TPAPGRRGRPPERKLAGVDGHRVLRVDVARTLVAGPDVAPRDVVGPARPGSRAGRATAATWPGLAGPFCHGGPSERSGSAAAGRTARDSGLYLDALLAGRRVPGAGRARRLRRPGLARGRPPAGRRARHRSGRRSDDRPALRRRALPTRGRAIAAEAAGQRA